MISDNIREVKLQIEDNKITDGDVTLVAVSKFRTDEEVAEVIKNGINIIAENRTSFLEDRAARFPDTEKHLIGHLQTNKVRHAVSVADMIQSVDSPRLLRDIDRIAGEMNKKQRILIQVNIAKEPQKYGIDAEELAPLVEEALASANVSLEGLMAIMPIEVDEKYYSDMYELFCRYRDSYREIRTLSMGMSNDFVIAVRHGANMVRIGRRLFI